MPDPHLLHRVCNWGGEPIGYQSASSYCTRLTGYVSLALGGAIVVVVVVAVVVAVVVVIVIIIVIIIVVVVVVIVVIVVLARGF